MEVFLLVILFLLAMQWVFHKKIMDRAMKFEEKLKNEIDDLEN